VGEGPAGQGQGGRPGRALGVDIGARRVGLALTDPTRTICSPFTAISMRSEGSLVQEIAALCAAHEVGTVVIGLPLSADGSEGPGCARARRVAEALGARGITAVLFDESWTSREAEDMLRSMGATRRADPGRVDALAASLILRGYLEEASRP
jgi:putative holliday junction resolvase